MIVDWACTCAARITRILSESPSTVSAMEEVELPQDHFVSRGYQQNFASHDKRVAVLDASCGALREPDRPIKSNFRERGFTTFVQAGVPRDLLEKAFCSVERRVLNEVRTIGLARRGPQQKADVANLFAIHLVRRSSLGEAIRSAAWSGLSASNIAEWGAAQVDPCQTRKRQPSHPLKSALRLVSTHKVGPRSPTAPYRSSTQRTLDLDRST